MRKAWFFTVVGACAAFPALAASMDAELSRGYAHLRAGDTEEALTIFRELLTDAPESELVKYSIGAAQYRRAVQLFESGDLEQANEIMSQVQDIFGELSRSATRGINENAAINWANSITDSAKRFDANEQYNERVQGLQQAVTAYESVLSEHPRNDRARANLDHARYELKRMLQKPPPDQNRSEDNESGQEGEEGENQEQEPGEDENEQENQDPSEQEENESENDGENEESDSPPNEQPQGQPNRSEQEKKDLDRQNIEAILESLEDQDREEQKNLRKARGIPQVRNGKWW